MDLTFFKSCVTTHFAQLTSSSSYSFCIYSYIANNYFPFFLFIYGRTFTISVYAISPHHYAVALGINITRGKWLNLAIAKTSTI